MIQISAVMGFSAADQRWPKTKANTARRGVMAPWQARCIQGYIAAHLHTTIRMVDLAGVLQFGLRRFKRAFKARFGCTPHQYVIRMRVERAKNLMMISNDSLGQIAVECGFVNQFHLSNVFCKIIGERPRRWRRFHADFSWVL